MAAGPGVFILDPPRVPPYNAIPPPPQEISMKNITSLCILGAVSVVLSSYSSSLSQGKY